MQKFFRNERKTWQTIDRNFPQINFQNFFNSSPHPPPSFIFLSAIKLANKTLRFNARTEKNKNEYRLKIKAPESRA